MSGGPTTTVCERIGQGRIMQCRSPGQGAWPAHIPNPPAVETRCTACDAYKASIGVLDRVKAEWAEYERRARAGCDRNDRSGDA